MRAFEVPEECAMEDAGYGLLRIPLPRTPVNKGGRRLHARACLSDSDVPSEPLSNQTRTSTPHCATSGRPARVLGSRWEAVPVATGTLTDRLPPALLQGRQHARP